MFFRESYIKQNIELNEFYSYFYDLQFDKYQVRLQLSNFVKEMDQLSIFIRVRGKREFIIRLGLYWYFLRVGKEIELQKFVVRGRMSYGE